MQARGERVHPPGPDPVRPRVARQDATDDRQVGDGDNQPKGSASTGDEETSPDEHGLAGREGNVEIVAKRTDETLSVQVRDNGTGLPEGKVGSGLGTQIVRTLIQGELGGTIDWHTMVGSGTEVTIEIPLAWLTKS